MMLNYQVKYTGCYTCVLGKTMLQVFAFILLSINVESQSLRTLSSSSAVIQPSFHMVLNSTRTASNFLPSSTPLLYDATISSTQDVQTSIFNRKETSLASSIFSSNETNILQQSSNSTHSIAQTSLQKTSILSSQSLSNSKIDILQQTLSSTQVFASASLQRTSILNSQSISNSKIDILLQTSSSTQIIANTSLQRTSILSSQSLSNSKIDILLQTSSSTQITANSSLQQTSILNPQSLSKLQNSVDSPVRTNVSTSVPQNRTKLTTALDFRTTPNFSVSQTGPVSHAATLSETKIIEKQSSVQSKISSVDSFTFTSLSLITPSRSVMSNDVNRTVFAESMLSRPQLVSSVIHTSNVSATTSVNIDTRLSSNAQRVTAPLRTVIIESSVRGSSVSKVLSSSVLQADQSIRTPTVGNASVKLTSKIAAVSFSTSFPHTTVQLHATLDNLSTIVPQLSIAADRSSSILSSVLVVSSVGHPDATSTVHLQPIISMLETSQSLLQSTFSFSELKTSHRSSINPPKLSSSTLVLSISSATDNASQFVNQTPNNTTSSQDIPQTKGQIFVTTNNPESQTLLTESTMSKYSTQVSSSTVSQARSVVPSYINSYEFTSSVKAGHSKLATPSLVTFSVLPTSNSVGIQPGIPATHISTPTVLQTSTVLASSISVVDSSSQYPTQDFSERTTATTPYQTLSVTSHLMPQSTIHSAFISQSQLTNGITSATLQTTTAGSLPDSSDGLRIITPSASIQKSHAASNTDVQYSKLSYSPFISDSNANIISDSNVMQTSQRLQSELATQPLGSAILSTSTPAQPRIPTTILSESQAKVQTTVYAKSSQLLSGASTNEQRLFSSVYPCWIVNTVYMTIDASAIYPNQTLHTETVIQATKSFDFLTQSSSVLAASSQKALFTGIPTESIAMVANESSSMHGIMSTSEVVHGSNTSSLSGLSESTTSHKTTVTPAQAILSESMVSSLSQSRATAVSFFLQPSLSATQMTAKSSFVTASPIGTNLTQTSLEPMMTTKANTESTVHQSANQSVDSTQFKQSTGSSSNAVKGSMAIPSLTATGTPSMATDLLQSTLDHKTRASSQGGQSFIRTSLQPSNLPQGTLASTAATSTIDSLSGRLTSQISVHTSLKATLEAPQSTFNVTVEVSRSASQANLGRSQFVSQTGSLSVPINTMSFRELPSSYVSSPLSASERSQLSGVIQPSTITQTLSTLLDKNVLPSTTKHSIVTMETATFVHSQQSSAVVNQPISAFEISQVSKMVQLSTVNPSRSAIVDTQISMTSATHLASSISSPESAGFVHSQQPSTDTSQPTSIMKSEISTRSTFVTAQSVVNASITKTSALASIIAAFNDSSKVQSLTAGNTMQSSSSELQQQLQSTVSSKKHTAYETAFPVSIVPTLRHNHTTGVGSSPSTMHNLTATATHQISNTTSSNKALSGKSMTITPGFKPSAGSATHSIGILAVSTNMAETSKSSSTVPVLRNTILTNSQSDKSRTMTVILRSSTETIVPSSSNLASSGNVTETPQISTSIPAASSVHLTIVVSNVTEAPQISTSIPAASSVNSTSVASNVIATPSLPITANIATSKQPQSSSNSMISSSPQAPDPVVIASPVRLKKRKRRAINGANDTSMILSNVSVSTSLGSPGLSSSGTFAAQETSSIVPTTSQHSQLTLPAGLAATASSYSSKSTGQLFSVIADTVRLLQSSDSTTSLQPTEIIGTTTSQFTHPTWTQLPVIQTGVMQPTLTVVNTVNVTAVSPSSQIVSNKSTSEALSATVQVNTSVVSMSLQDSVPSSQGSNFTTLSSVSTPSLLQVPPMGTNVQTSGRFSSQTSSVSKPESNSSSFSTFESSSYVFRKSLESNTPVIATIKSESNSSSLPTAESSKQVIDISSKSDSLLIAASSNIIVPSRTLLSGQVVSVSLSGSLEASSLQATGISSSFSSVALPLLTSNLPVFTSTHLQHSGVLSSAESSGSKTSHSKSIMPSIGSQVQVLARSTIQQSSLVTVTVTTAANESSQSIVSATQRAVDNTLASPFSTTSPIDMQYSTSAALPVSGEQSSRTMLSASTIASQSLGGSLTLIGSQTTSNALKIDSPSNILSLLATVSRSESIFTEMASSSTVSIMPSIFGVESSSPHMTSQTATTSKLTSSDFVGSPDTSFSVPQSMTSKFDAFQSQSSPSTTAPISTSSSAGMTGPVTSTVETGSKLTAVSSASSSPYTAAPKLNSPSAEMTVSVFSTGEAGSKHTTVNSASSSPSTTTPISTNSSAGMTASVFSTGEARSKRTTVNSASRLSNISPKITDSVHETSDSVATGSVTSPLLSPSIMLESPSKTSSLMVQSLDGSSPYRTISSAISNSFQNVRTQNAQTASQQSVNPRKSTTVVTYVTSSLGQCIAYYTPRLATPSLSTLGRPSVVSQLTSRPVQETSVNTASILLKSTPRVVLSSTPSYQVFVSSDDPPPIQTQTLTTVPYSMNRSLATSEVTDLTSASSQNMTSSLLPVETQTASVPLTAISAVSQVVSSADEKVGQSHSSTIPSLTRDSSPLDASPSASLSKMSKDSSTVNQDSVYHSTNMPLSTSPVATDILLTTSYVQQLVPTIITASQTLLQSSATKVATPAISSGDSAFSTSQYSSTSNVPVYETTLRSHFASSVTLSLSKPASDAAVFETISSSTSASPFTPSLFKPETTVRGTTAPPSYFSYTSKQVSTSIHAAISTSLRISTFMQPYTSTVLPLKKSSGISSQTASKAASRTSSIFELPASSSLLQPVVPTAASTKDVIAPSASLGASSLASVTASSSFTLNTMTSQVPTSTPVVTTTQPISVGLCDLVLIVAPAVDITSAAFKLDLETKLVETFNKVKLLRKRRAVTQAGTTVNVTSVTRRGSTSNIDVEFYVKENNVIVPAQRTTAVLNQLTVSALGQRLNQTVASPVVVVTASTTSKPTTAAVTVAPPKDYQILGMVLTDEASNNISSGNNRALFETRMAQYYRNGKGISATVNFTISFLVHEVKNIVYLEFYVTVDNVRQNSTVIAMFYHASNVTVTISTLSALLKMTVITEPYSISSISASDLLQVKMTIKPSTPTNMNTAQFKNDLALRITTLYREAKDTTVKRKRRALGSITTTIISLVTNTNSQATVIFYILDQGLVQNGASVASILNRGATNRMSAILGVEVITVPAAVAVLPVPAAKSTDYLWIIGVVVGACVLMIIVGACIYWRWKIGGPQGGKLDIEEISMNEKKKDAEKGVPYGGYRDISKFAEGRSRGGPAMKTTTFTSPPDTEEKPDLSRSMRRKVRQNNGVATRPAGRQNTAYEESEEDDIDDDEEEYDDDDDYESKVPAPPLKQQVSRPVSAQRRVAVQPGPSRDPKRTAAAVQKSSAASKRREEEESDYDDDDDDDDSEEDDHSQRVPSVKSAKESQRPAAAELPPIRQMKDVQEAPSYPPVRFRTNIEPETSKIEHLPPLMKTGTSLIGRKLPDIDPDLKQKSDLERSRNKQRQRLRASGRRPDMEKRNEVENTKTEKRAWRKAQLDIDSLLDPVAASSRRSPRASSKRGRRRHNRFRRSHKVDIAAGEPQKELDESKNVKLNNYMSLSSPRHSVSVDESDDTRTEEDRDTNIEEARERIHNLLDDAFTILDPYKRKPSPRTAPAPVTEERLLEGKEEALSQAPMPEALPQRYKVPALPPPPHGRATAPPPGERKRMFNYSMPPSQMQQSGLTSMNGTQPLTPVVTRDPMVVMDRAEKNRYLSQRLGQSAYGRPPAPFAYTYEKSPNDQPVFITPVQQQPDGLGGVIWSPYTAEVIRDDINSSSAPLFNTMESPAHEQFNMKSTPIMSTPQSQRIRQPQHTSIDMTTSPYTGLGYGETPQPLIRAIKDELLRLSQHARGRTQIQELNTDEMRRDPTS